MKSSNDCTTRYHKIRREAKEAEQEAEWAEWEAEWEAKRAGQKSE